MFMVTSGTLFLAHIYTTLVQMREELGHQHASADEAQVLVFIEFLS